MSNILDSSLRIGSVRRVKRSLRAGRLGGIGWSARRLGLVAIEGIAVQRQNNDSENDITDKRLSSVNQRQLSFLGPQMANG